jgi:hypothetical protein
MLDTTIMEEPQAFWVIFDICTIPDYYVDPHNILALPRGAIYRYDYQETHFSAQALKLAREKTNPCQRYGYNYNVVLVYAQDLDYTKGAATPKHNLTMNGSMFVMLRQARLRRLCRGKRGATDRFYFEMEMGAYPKQPQSQGLEAILAPLIEARDVPYSVLVATSNKWDAMDCIAAEDSSEGFGEVVRVLGKSRSQFAGDSFWRIARATETHSGREVLPIPIDEVRSAADAQQEKPLLDWQYEFDDLSQILLELEAQEPSENNPTTIGQRDVLLSVTGPAKDLVGLSREVVTLRRYGVHDLSLSIQASNSLRPTTGELTITTKRPEALKVFPVGPELRIKFKVTKNPERAKAALLAVAVGAIATLIAGLAPLEVQWRVVAVVIAFFATLGSGLLWAGTVPFFAGRR